MNSDAADWPKTLEEAANRVLGELDEETRARTRNANYDDLARFHFGLGSAIRTNLGLWNKDSPLMVSMNHIEADECSMEIIQKVWAKLQEALAGC